MSDRTPWYLYVGVGVLVLCLAVAWAFAALGGVLTWPFVYTARRTRFIAHVHDMSKGVFG